MNRYSDEIEQIENAQAALRESIERTKELAEQTEGLLSRHKKHLEDEGARATAKPGRASPSPSRASMVAPDG